MRREAFQRSKEQLERKAELLKNGLLFLIF